jgi:hypothetical protein
VNSTYGLSFLIVLAILGFTIISILKVIKEDSKLPATTNRQLNFIADIIRFVFYTLSLVFVGPFVFENSEKTFLLISFWLFAFALIFFIIRKIIKWRYYLLDDVGKNKL